MGNPDHPPLPLLATLDPKVARLAASRINHVNPVTHRPDTTPRTRIFELSGIRNPRMGGLRSARAHAQTIDCASHTSWELHGPRRIGVRRSLSLIGQAIAFRVKVGTKSRPIRLVDGDHEIDCKMDGFSIALKAMYVKKVQ